jgi:hypothetical protein
MPSWSTLAPGSASTAQSKDIRRSDCGSREVVERLWRSLKYEEIYLKAYQNVAEAQHSIAAYFDFYNHERLHPALGYRAPRQVFEEATLLTKLRRGRKPLVPTVSQRHNEVLFSQLREGCPVKWSALRRG